MEAIQRIVAGLPALGTKRLILAGLVTMMVFLTVAAAGFYLSRPAYETLYTNLERQDIARIGVALGEAGIGYDVDGNGKSLLVEIGRKRQARMLLAQKGLPSGMGAGYELFDDLGSLGLTSFMQEITRVRALEGEIARTIQLMDSIQAARVHIVLPDKASFRSDRQAPSASVVIRSTDPDSQSKAQAIRYMVAAAIPGLSVERVTVLDTHGSVLASGEDAAASVPRKMIDLEHQVAEEIRDNINSTLAPFLGTASFQTSVTAQLNTDQKNIQETIFDPESRVERSVRVIKENGSSKNANATAAATVEEDLPNEDAGPQAGSKSSETRERREEMTNYEVNSKTVSTVTNGYGVERLAVAVVVDQKRIVEALGEAADKAAINQQLEEIRQLVASAIGFNEDRGDQIKVSAVDFLETSGLGDPVPDAGLSDLVAGQIGTIVRALTMLVIVVLVLLLGVRPVLKALARDQQAPAIAGALDEGEAGTDLAVASSQGPGSQGGPEQLPNPALKDRDQPQQRLQQLVEMDADNAVSVMKQWSREGAAA